MGPLTRSASESPSIRIMTRTPREWVAWLSPGLMVLLGVVLFLIPAPPTSLIGIALVVVGGILWLIDYFGGESGRGGREPMTGND